MFQIDESSESLQGAASSRDLGLAHRATPEPRQISVIGCGHVGLVLAAGLADMGHRVIGVDVSETLVAELCAGILRIQEPGLADLVAEGVASGRLLFTTSYAYAVPQADVIFLAVDTPQTLAGAADLRNIRAATRSIAASLNGSTPIIANKSTSPIGTGETIEEILATARWKSANAAPGSCRTRSSSARAVPSRTSSIRTGSWSVRATRMTRAKLPASTTASAAR